MQQHTTSNTRGKTAGNAENARRAAGAGHPADTLTARTLRRLLPGVREPKAVAAWGMFDLANQSFTLLVNTLLFPLFFREVVVADPAWDDTAWAILVAVSLLCVVVLAPPLGAIADARACKKKILCGTGIVCCALTCALAFLPAATRSAGGAGTVAVLIAAAVYIPANAAYALGGNALAAFLPELADRKTMGRVSGFGWAMGYAGAVGLLVCVVGGMLLFGKKDHHQWRPFFLFAGLWFAVMATPTLLLLRERATPQTKAGGLRVIKESFGRVRRTIADAGKLRQLFRFLGAFLVYSVGVQIVIFFASVMAKEDFGFTHTKLVLFVLVLTVSAGAGAVGAMLLQDRLGHKRMLCTLLLVWTGAAMAMAGMKTAAHTPAWAIWGVGNAIGVAMGGTGAASRAMVGILAPKARTAECFGLWGLCYNAAGLGVPVFGFLRDRVSGVAALVTLAACFAIGLVGVLRVDVRKGLRDAADADRQPREG